MKLSAHSMERWRASASEKRHHGGSTVTLFWIYRGDEKLGEIVGYGKTPGERKTYALEKARERFGQ